MSAFDTSGVPFRFDGSRPRDADPTVPGSSTVDALRLVELNAQFDLAGKRPYAHLEIRRVVLARLPSGTSPADAIFAFAVDELAPRVDDLRGEPPLAVVRPVQRYVRHDGLVRAREVNDTVLARLGDPWGFARFPEPSRPGGLSITPPVLEQAATPDQDRETPFLQLVVCDGNHRVVERVWNRSMPMAAVAVLGEPSEPYYAHPGGWLAWEQTAGNVLAHPPPAHEKYRVRDVTLDRLAAEARDLLVGHPPDTWYRRYFRDLTKGFGDLGEQGGPPLPPGP